MLKFTFLLLSLLQVTAAFSPAATFGVQPSSVLFAGQRDSEGGAALAKPKIKTSQKVETVIKQAVKSTNKARTYDPISRRDEEFEEAPMFKLMLLSDSGADAAHVVERMCAIMEDMDEDQAATVFKQADMSGKAMCGKYPFEVAELYKEQLIRSDPMIFSDLEEENA
jgi:ATP-dependent Clp protease adapter protein ClpS